MPFDILKFLFQFVSVICAIVVVVFYIKAAVSWMTIKEPKELSNEESTRLSELEIGGWNTADEYREHLRLSGKQKRLWRRPTLLLCVFLILAFVVAGKWGFGYTWSVIKLLFRENGM